MADSPVGAPALVPAARTVRTSPAQQVTAETYVTAVQGGTLRRGFWLYVWEATTSSGEQLLYVGRTGDSSSCNAQSPFNRMGQHLGNAKNSSMLRNHLENHSIVPESCTFRLVAHGPILDEADDMPTHMERRDVVGAMEKQLADDLRAAGYVVMNDVHCNKELDRQLYGAICEAFADAFPDLEPSI
jgi:hypothetical protein